MKIAWQKKIFWVLLAMSSGFIVLIGVIFISLNFQIPLEWSVLVCLSTAAIALFCSILGLRRCYRMEPGEGGGHWHVSIAECFAATFFAAFCMMLWQNLWPETFLYWGAVVSIVAGSWFLVSMLVTARRGYERFSSKIGMATGIMFSSYGLFAVGSMITFAIVIAIISPRGLSQLSEFLRGILGICYLVEGYDDVGHYWMKIALRLGLILLPIGLIIMRVMKKSEKLRQQDVAK